MSTNNINIFMTFSHFKKPHAGSSKSTFGTAVHQNQTSMWVNLNPEIWTVLRVWILNWRPDWSVYTPGGHCACVGTISRMVGAAVTSFPTDRFSFKAGAKLICPLFPIFDISTWLSVLEAWTWFCQLPWYRLLLAQEQPQLLCAWQNVSIR
jgi:hypothetical protein